MKDKEREGASICRRERGTWRESRILRLRGKGVCVCGGVSRTGTYLPKEAGWYETTLWCTEEAVNEWIFKVILPFLFFKYKEPILIHTIFFKVALSCAAAVARVIPGIPLWELLLQPAVQL